MSGSKRTISRRGFLSAAGGSLLSAGLLNLNPAITLAEGADDKADGSSKEIIYRKLGRTDIHVPIVSIGVMNSENPEIIQASYEIGVRYFNLSGNYQLGRIETVAAGVLNKLQVRDKVIIGTGNDDVEAFAGLSASECKRKITAACEASLSRLKTDYIDIYYVWEGHDPRNTHNPAMLEALEYLKQQQKIRHAGVSMHSNMAEAINAVADGGYFDVVMTTFNFTLSDDSKLLAAIKNAAAKGVGVIAMKMMAGGSRWPNESSRRDHSSAAIATACIKWVLRNPAVSTSVPGFMSYEHMRQDFSVARDLEYTPEEERFLSDNSVKLGMGFCRQCKSCLAYCPKKVDIPTLMRVHMYAAQYGDLYRARVTLDSISSGSDLRVCKDCSTCRAICANSVEIASRIDELKAIYT
ncbi:MAG: aldo/keto reductase [Candidatus Zixiibacteriota bacterium]